MDNKGSNINLGGMTFIILLLLFIISLVLLK
jgi:hypothetical protein